jgi:hypothetical protein
VEVDEAGRQVLEGPALEAVAGGGQRGQPLGDRGQGGPPLGQVTQCLPPARDRPEPSQVGEQRPQDGLAPAVLGS